MMLSLKCKVYIGSGTLLAILFTMSTFHLMLLFWAFFAGVAFCVFILRPGFEVPNLLRSHIEKQKLLKLTNVPKQSACGVCGEENCKREKRENEFESLQPWIGVNLNEKVDKALSEFLEILLQQYVWNWYRELSEDEMFVYELKIALRHCIAVIYRRVNKIDLAEVIIKKLLRLAIIHLNVCMSASQAGCNSEDEILMWYGARVHQALKSRRSELNYIRALCDNLFPYLFPTPLIESRVGKSFLREVLASNVILYGIDAIDDPDKVNNLLLIFFDKALPREADSPSSPMVPLLAEFTSKDFKATNSLLYIDLPKIMTTQDMLYQFMTFLKTVGAVHHLQFCLTVHDFNRRCLSQEQDDEQQAKLHSEARDIYNSYCCVDSPTFIHFDEDIINELKDIANGHWYEVSRLRTSTPLFRAYDHVYNLLEHLYCPLFYQSDIYYQMVCGNRLPGNQKKAMARQGMSKHLERDNSMRSSLKRKKQKEAAKIADEAPAEEMDMDPDTNLIEDDEKTAQLLLEDEIQEDCLTNRDLSTWRIGIPRIEVMRRDDDPSRPSTSANERWYAFCVEVKRVDIQEDDEEPEQWHVLRRYNEFYVLESKLTEFHGTLHPAGLPPKKMFSRNFDFLDSKRAEFERFLKTLISQPVLRRSELVYDFLLPERAGAVSRFYSKLLPDVKLGRLFRRVPTKLLKEKGQHLTAFLQSFIQSCESPKPKPGKYEPITDNPEIQMDHKLHNDLYPESDWQFDAFQSATEVDNDKKDDFLTGVCDYLTFIVVRVFEVDLWIHYVMVGIKTLFKNTIEPFTHHYLKAKIDCYRQEHHVIDIVHLFRDILFYNNDPPRTTKDKEKRRSETYRCWKEFIPDSFVSLIGANKHKSGCKKMFEVLQQPKLNKQLGYLLLDAILLELFPELNTPSSDV